MIQAGADAQVRLTVDVGPSLHAALTAELPPGWHTQPASRVRLDQGAEPRPFGPEDLMIPNGPGVTVRAGSGPRL